MKYKFRIFVLSMLCLVCTISCTTKSANNYDEPDWLSNTYPEYDQERQVIYFKEQLRQDIKGDIAVPFIDNTNEFGFACELSFFNYGEDIRLFNGCKDDCFIMGIGTIIFAYVLESEDKIEIVNKNHSEKYGDWALVNLTIGNSLVKDVFMTPLSMKAYKDGDDDSFILLQFVASNKHMNVLFYGGPRECIIVRYCPNVILLCREPSFNIDTPMSGPGKFWHLNENVGY